MANIVTNILFSILLETPTNMTNTTWFSTPYEKIGEGPGFVSWWTKDQPDIGLQRIPRGVVSPPKKEEPERYPLQ